MIQARLIITGKVQGVFYRFHATKTAQQLGLSGWVKNKPDGSVSALVQGEQSAVQQFIEWCKEGSPSAQVGNVEVAIEPIQEKMEGFYTSKDHKF